MAEIKIEKKKPVWPWVLLVLIVLGLIIYFLAFNESEEESTIIPTDTEVSESTQVNPDNSTVNDYVEFINNDPDQMGLDHEYTNEALRKLTDATEAIANEVDYDVEGDIQSVRDYAQKVTQDPFETTHANSIKSAADILANVLQNIQQADYPGLNNQAQNVRNAASAITPEELTLDQKEAVKNFFREAANLLEQMN